MKMLILKRNHIPIDINLLSSVKTVLLVKSMLSKIDYFKLVIENIYSLQSIQLEHLLLNLPTIKVQCIPQCINFLDHKDSIREKLLS